MIPRRGERGFALVIVLWTMSLVALIGTQVTAAGHVETKIAQNLRASAIAEAAADAAIDEAALHLMDASNGRWVSDGPVYVSRVGQVTTLVTIRNEERKMPINTSPTALLAALFREVGVSQNTALVLADEIGDWRSPANFPLRLGAKAPQYKAAGREWGPANRPYRTIGELRLLLGMTPEIFERIAPHLTPYTESAPQSKSADPLVLRAIEDVTAGGLQPLAFDESPTFSIIARALTPEGARFTRRAVIRINLASAGPVRKPFDMLAWSAGDDDPERE